MKSKRTDWDLLSGGKGLIQKFMLGVYTMLDISEQLNRLIDVIAEIDDNFTLMILGVLGVICAFFLGVCAYIFDITPTHHYLQSVLFPYFGFTSVGIWAVTFAWALSISPTALEILGARLAGSMRAMLMQILVWIIILFDMFTNAPFAFNFTLHHVQLFENATNISAVNYFLFWGAFYAFLFLCAFGFELLFVVFSAFSLICFYKALSS